MSCGCQLGYEDYPLWSAPRRGLRGLAAITPDQAAQQAMPKSTISSKAGFTQQVYNNIVSSAQNDTFYGFNPSGCSGASGTGGAVALSLAGSGAGLALKAASTAGLITSGIATAGISIAIGGIISLFSTIYAHHAAAVKKEQQVECAAVPAAQNYLQVIDQAVANGQATPAQAIQALNSLLSDFESKVSSITKNNASQCNAGCVWTKELEAIVAYKVSLYQDMENIPVPVGSPVPPTSPARPNTVATPGAAGGGAGVPTSSSYASFYSGAAASAPATSSLPGWLPIAAIALGAVFLLR